jgi:hypothetical protein
MNAHVRDNLNYLYARSTGRERLSLPISACSLPDDSAGSAAAQLQRRTSSDATDPQLFWTEALFDDTTNEHIYFEFVMPDNYSSAPVVDVYYKMTSGTSNEVIFGAAICAVTDGDSTDLDADALGTTNDSSATTVPGTAGYMDVCSITMTNADSVAANDRVILEVHRHADDAGDDATGDAEVVLVVLRFTGSS